MPSSLNLDSYKQAIADSYDRRSSTYDEGEWRKLICEHLLSYSQVHKRQAVLDIGTGTGYLAIAVAKKVGSQGSVVGVDLSSKMLNQARSKVKEIKLSNIQFQLADAEKLDYQDACFDYVLCANTFPWISDKETTLKSWYRFLKPGGRIAVHTPADTAYVGSVVLRRVLATHNIELEPSNRLGSIEQCKELFATAGFRNIEIKQEQHGRYISFESASAYWKSIVEAPTALSLKISDDISQCSPTQLAEIKSEFEAALVTQQTEEGIWDNLTTLYVLGQKPDVNQPSSYKDESQ